VENGILEVRPCTQLPNPEEVPVFTSSEKGLIKRRQPLLSVEDQKRVLVAIQRWRALELPTGEDTDIVTDPKQGARRIVVRDRHDQVLSSPGIPDEVSLEIGEHHGPVMYARQQVLEGVGIGILK
jgi:hypothetical protein